MKFNTYEEIRDYIKSKANEKELIRINEEDELFQKRDWCQYIRFVVEVNNEIKNKNTYCDEWLSAMDSYFIFKACNPNLVNEDLLNDENAKCILFNDALRLRINIIDPNDPWGENKTNVVFESTKILDEIFERQISSFDFKYKHVLLDYNQDNGGTELFVISKDNVTNEEFEIMKNVLSKKDTNEEENKLLYKNLFVTIFARIRRG